MSDLVRGTVSDPVLPAPAAPPASARPAPVVPGPVVENKRERLSLATVARAGATDAPAVTPPKPTASAERAPASGDAPDAVFVDLQRAIGRVRALLKTSEPFPWTELTRLLERVIADLDGSGELFWIANNPAGTPTVDYLALHQSRVTVLALRVGVIVGYDRSRLIELGLAASLLDIGLWQLPESLLRRLDALSADEQTLYRSHPRVAAEIIRRWAPPAPGIVDAVLQHHEREQGQGFPQGLAGPAIHPNAKLLGLVDTYTGLTLPPSARPRLRPHEAIRDIVRSKHESFPSALIKALLSEISVFPPGTLVRLNTGDVGRVIRVNRNHPLRPRLEIVSDSKGHRLAASKVTDLSEAPFLYITGPVAEVG